MLAACAPSFFHFLRILCTLGWLQCTPIDCCALWWWGVGHASALCGRVWLRGMRWRQTVTTCA